MVSRKGPRASSTGSGPDPSALKSRPSRESKRRASVTSPPPTPSGKRQKPQTRLALQTVRDTRQSVKSGQRDTSQTPKRRQSHGCSPIGSEAINRRLKVYWPTRKQWLDGLVTEFNKEDDKHFVKYDSGEEQWLTIKAKEDNRRLKWISNSEQNLLEENSVVATSSAAGAGSRSEAGQTSQQKSQDVALDSRETPKPSCSVNSEQWEPLETAVRISGAAGGSAYEPTSSCLHGKRVKGGSRKVDQGTEMVDTGTQSGRKSGCEKVSHRDIARVEASSRIGMQLSAANSEQKQETNMLKSEPVEDKAQDMDASAKLISGGVLVGLKAEASYVSACGSEAHPCDEQVSPGVRTQAGNGNGTAKRRSSNAGGVENLDVSSEREVRQKAEIAWLRTYEALNKAVRLIQLTREGAPGDKIEANGKPLESLSGLIKSPRSGERSPGVVSPSGRKASASLRAKQGRSSDKEEPSTGDAAIRTRVAVFWPGDRVYYKGRISEYNKDKDLYCIQYDDGEDEWLNLADEYFKWLGPRARSAGFTHAQCAAMMTLRPDGITPPSAEHLADKIQKSHTDGPTGAAAVGWRVGILWEADGNYYEGEVLSFNSKSSKHHILYEDGEDEWVQLNKEVKCWRHKGRGASKPAGLAPGVDAPRGRAAIGWRVGVYWKDDAVFYPGEIRGYDSATGKHHIHYDDNEDEHISLSTEKIKWIVPPGVPERKESHRRKQRGASGRPAKRMSLNNAGGSETLCGFETSRVEPSAAEGEKVIRSAPRESAPNLQRSAGSAPLLQPKPQPVVPIPEGAVCRQMPKSALMCIDESGKGGASSTGKYSFEDFLRVCVIAPRAPAQAEVSMPGQQVRGAAGKQPAPGGRLWVVSKMLSRVCAGQESLKQGLPPGTKACRTVGEQVAQISRNLPALARPSPDLPPIRTSSRPLQTSIVLPKTQFAALQVQSPFQSEAGQVPQSADQQNLSPQVPTPTAFQLDSSPRRVGSSPLPGPTTQRNGPTGGSKSRPSVSLDAVPVVSLVCPNTASQHLGI